MPVHPRVGSPYRNGSPRRNGAGHQNTAHKNGAAHADTAHQNGASGEHTTHQNGSKREHDDRPVPAGEVLSFESLFRTYHAKLCAFARSYVKCPDVAEELVEEVFLRMWELRGNWPGCANQKRYLYAAVRNQALKHLAHECVVRQSHAIVKEQVCAPGMGQPPAAPDDEVQAAELASAIQVAVEQLPPRCREAYVLNREHGMSYAEIAEVMGISVRTVETQLARANRVLRRELATWVS